MLCMMIRGFVYQKNKVKKLVVDTAAAAAVEEERESVVQVSERIDEEEMQTRSTIKISMCIHVPLCEI